MAAVDIEGILSTLTLEEKILLLSGKDLWTTNSIPSKGIPSVKLSDGPNGARGASFSMGTTAACFPAACAIASTFDTDLAYRIGTALAEETITKGARCLLGPTVCVHRHPLGGRNFESFSEDPFLSGKLAAQLIRGCQMRGISATIKHFVANEQETFRLIVDEEISQRALREVYLRPFELAIREGNPWAVMTSYNSINGTHADSSPLLETVLRQQWGWDGLVLSDWGGTNSTAEALNAGLDLEMPGQTRWRSIEQVTSALHDGTTTLEIIDQRVLKILRFLQRLDCFQDPAISDERAVDSPSHRALIREAGSKGLVLLKNENGILPLSKEKMRGKRIAMLGYAKAALAHGGGSASVNAHYETTPWDALSSAYGNDVQLCYAKGAHTFRNLPPIHDNIVGMDGSPGFTYSIFEPGSSAPSETFHGHPRSEISALPPHRQINKEVRLEGFFEPAETTGYYFTCASLGPSKLMIDGMTVCQQNENTGDPMGFLFGGAYAEEVKVELQAGKRYHLRFHCQPPIIDNTSQLGFLKGRIGLRAGCMSEIEHDKDLLSEAVELARASDIAIVFTGHEPSWETEGQDQASFSLPKNGSQDALIEAIASVNENTIVVNSTGVPVAMPWLGKIRGLIQAWFLGQEGGNAIADILTGTATPEGHLTCTFPKALEDCPAYESFPGTFIDGHFKTVYKEGIFVGYRHFDRLPQDMVNFPFGFGLSYTTFAFSKLQISKLDDHKFAIEVTIANSGHVRGGVAVQLYVGRDEKHPDHPIKQLVAFRKVSLDAGKSTLCKMTVESRDFAFYDESTKDWKVMDGVYRFSVGRSVVDIVEEVTIKIRGVSFDV